MSSGIVWMNRATWDSLKQWVKCDGSPDAATLSFCGRRVLFDEDMEDGQIKGLPTRVVEYLQSGMNCKPVESSNVNV